MAALPLIYNFWRDAIQGSKGQVWASNRVNPQQQSRESLLFEILWSLIAFPFSSTGLKVKLSFIKQIWNSSEATQESYHYCGKENNNSSLYQNKRTIIVLFTPKRESYHYCGQENACQYIYIYSYIMVKRTFMSKNHPRKCGD